MTRITLMKIAIKNRTCFFIFFLILFVPLLVGSCSKDSTSPRPYGYYRVDLPPKAYIQASLEGYPYSFDISTSAHVIPRYAKGEKYWIDINYPALKANIHVSYKPVHVDLFNLVEDTRKIVYKHAVKADNIAEIPYEHPEKRVFGILYELTGNTASPMQFVLTDSSSHFFRGALYFESVPNKDSIAPIAQYIQGDIVRLVESFEWKK
ncbi:MAG: gliding motility lipoprotein GldD [Paludibacteraceae bacterium]